MSLKRGIDNDNNENINKKPKLINQYLENVSNEVRIYGFNKSQILRNFHVTMVPIKAHAEFEMLQLHMLLTTLKKNHNSIISDYDYEYFEKRMYYLNRITEVEKMVKSTNKKIFYCNIFYFVIYFLPIINYISEIIKNYHIDIYEGVKNNCTVVFNENIMVTQFFEKVKNWMSPILDKQVRIIPGLPCQLENALFKNVIFCFNQQYHKFLLDLMKTLSFDLCINLNMVSVLQNHDLLKFIFKFLIIDKKEYNTFLNNITN